MSEATTPTETTAPTPPTDPLNRMLASAGLALGALAVAELIGTVTIGLAVKVTKLNFLNRQGYGFLTQLEKSPVGLVLVVASVFTAIAVIRSTRDGNEEVMATYGSWLVIAGSVLLGVGTILAVLARFRVADLVASQPVDAIQRRVLMVFVIRNFGTAVVALLIAVGAAFQRARPSTSG